MWRLKSCPKCKGDLFVERDLDGWAESCLQCGYTREVGYVRDLKSILEAGKQPVEEEKEPVLAGAGGRKRR